MRPAQNAAMDLDTWSEDDLPRCITESAEDPFDAPDPETASVSVTVDGTPIPTSDPEDEVETHFFESLPDLADQVVQQAEATAEARPARRGWWPFGRK